MPANQYLEPALLMVGHAFLAVVISGLANNFQGAYSNILAPKTCTDMFSDGMKHLLHLPYFEFQDQRSGEPSAY